MSTTPDVESAVRALLIADATVAGFIHGPLYAATNQTEVGDRIYPDVLAQGSAMPALSYFEVSDVPSQTTDGPNGVHTARIQIDAWSLVRSEARRLADAVFDVLAPYQPLRGVGHRVTVTLADGSRVEIQGAIPSVRRSAYESETKLYRRGRDYVVTAALAA